MKSVTYVGTNNVGGALKHENLQVFYFTPDFSAVEFYEDSTVTVANGDKIFLEIAGIFDYITETRTATETVVGGTGRFEGAEGLILAKPGFIKDVEVVVYDGGSITTAGEAKKE